MFFLFVTLRYKVTKCFIGWQCAYMSIVSVLTCLFGHELNFLLWKDVVAHDVYIVSIST